MQVISLVCYGYWSCSAGHMHYQQRTTPSLHPPTGVREALACGLHLPWKGLMCLSTQVNDLSSSCAWG